MRIARPVEHRPFNPKAMHQPSTCPYVAFLPVNRTLLCGNPAQGSLPGSRNLGPPASLCLRPALEADHPDDAQRQRSRLWVIQKLVDYLGQGVLDTCKVRWAMGCQLFMPEIIHPTLIFLSTSHLTTMMPLTRACRQLPDQNSPVI